MKEQALATARKGKDRGQSLNLLREYLQDLILASLHESEAFRPLAFVGGTALRLLHNLPRFSEDLDFSLVTPEGYAGHKWMAKVKRDLTLAGFQPEVSWNDRKAVHTAWVRLPGLLREADLSALSGEKLAVKVEIDTRPPAGARCERRIVTRTVTLLLQHYDLPSMLAGKLHAVLTRRYPKGRDWYDLVWYRSQRPPVEPNVPLLQAALDQTEGTGRHDAHGWRGLARRRLAALDASALADDVRPFLERPQESTLLTSENLAALLADG